MEATNNCLGLSNYRWENIVEDHPELTEVKSLSEVSKVIFGIKSLTALVSKYSYGSSDDVKRLKEFFGQDHSSLTTWAKQSANLSFYPTVEHRKIYNKMIRELGLELTVRFTNDRDFADIAVGYEFVASDKKRTNAFKNDILGALSLFPVGAHSKMIHDYFVDKMKAAERKNSVKTPRNVVPTLPLPLNVSEENGPFKVLVPKHETDLRRIGNAQSHCVGTAGMGYAQKIKSGHVWIFAVYTKSLADGVCVEVTKSGQVIQIQGKHRRGPKPEEHLAIVKVIDQLLAG